MHVDVSPVTDIVVPTDPIFFWEGSMSGSDMVMLQQDKPSSTDANLARYDDDNCSVRSGRLGLGGMCGFGNAAASTYAPPILST